MWRGNISLRKRQRNRGSKQDLSQMIHIDTGRRPPGLRGQFHRRFGRKRRRIVLHHFTGGAQHPKALRLRGQGGSKQDKADRKLQYSAHERFYLSSATGNWTKLACSGEW